MGKIEDRLKASLKYDALNGDSFEKGVVERQIAEAIQEIRQLRNDALIMALRLYGEDSSTFGPECYSVMKRWEGRVQQALTGAVKEG